LGQEIIVFNSCFEVLLETSVLLRTKNLKLTNCLKSGVS